MDFVELYYEFTHGCYPYDTDKPRERTQKTIDYLIDAGVTHKDIFVVVENAPQSESLTHDLLPDWLWENSLLERDRFYYHNSLQLISKSPIMNSSTLEFIEEPFYLEMKIKYTIHDLLNYFYSKANVELSFRDEKKDIGAMAHLLNQYSKIDFIEPVDFMLSLIDYAVGDRDCSTSSIFQLDTEYRTEVFDILKRKTAEAEAYKLNKVVYR